MKILILSSRFGMGHFAAAKTLADKIDKSIGDVEVCVEDVLEYAIDKQSCDYIYDSYFFVVNHSGRMVKYVSKLIENEEKDIKNPFEGIMLKVLEKLIEDRKPDIIISTYSYYARLASLYIDKTGSKVPLVTYITDVSTHKVWINPNTDLYMVASDTTKQELIRRGISADNIIISGIPVKEEFKDPAASIQEETKRLLIMGGGFGLVPKTVDFYEQINALPNVKTTVICARNKKIYEKLHGKFENIEVIGFSDKVHEYMKEADLLITKPGGLTVFEAIHSQLPMMVFNPILIQEVHNSIYIEKNNIGFIMYEKAEKSVNEIYNVINNDSLLHKIRTNMRAIQSQFDEEALARYINKHRTQEVLVEASF